MTASTLPVVVLPLQCCRLGETDTEKSSNAEPIIGYIVGSYNDVAFAHFAVLSSA